MHSLVVLFRAKATVNVPLHPRIDNILRLMTRWRIRGNIIRTAICYMCMLIMHSSYSFRLRISFCVLYILYRFFLLRLNFLLYYVFMCALTGKAVPEMTRYVLSGTFFSSFF